VNQIVVIECYSGL